MSHAQDTDAVVLRPAWQRDVAAMAHIARGAGARGWDAASLLQELERSWAQVTVAATVVARDVVGFSVCWWVADEGQLLYIAVQPERRRGGIGRQLLSALVDEARRRGAERIDLEVRRDNEAAVGLYRRCGFVAVGERRGYYQQDGTDAILMSRVISTP